MAEQHDFAVAPRDIGAYRKAEHFDDMYDDPMRFVTSEMVRETVERGEGYPSEGGEGKERRRLEYDGVYCTLVIAHADDPPVLVTGWTEIRHRAKALASGRWDLQQLTVIQAFMDSKHQRHGRYAHSRENEGVPLDVELQR